MKYRLEIGNFFVKKQLLPVFLGSFQIIMYLCARTQMGVGALCV